MYFLLFSLINLFICQIDGEEKSIVVNFVGDISFANAKTENHWEIRYNMQDLFSSKIRALFGAGDLNIGNLESAVVNDDNLTKYYVPRSAQVKASPLANFLASKSNIQQLKDSNFHALSLCNNHWFDAGIQGSLQSADILHRHDIIPLCEPYLEFPAQTSAFNNRKHHNQSINYYSDDPDVYIQGVSVSGWTFGILSINAAVDVPYPCYNYASNQNITHASNLINIFTPCLVRKFKDNNLNDTSSTAHERTRHWQYNETTITTMLNLINRAVKAQRYEMIIVYLHWGQQFQDKVTVEQRSLARRLANAGVDMIVGHHPHRLHGIEVISRTDRHPSSLPAGIPQWKKSTTVVVYSLGSFLFPLFVSREPSIILSVKIIKEISGCRMKVCLLPTEMHAGRVELLEGSQRDRVLEHIYSLSRGLQETNYSWSHGCIQL